MSFFGKLLGFRQTKSIDPKMPQIPTSISTNRSELSPLAELALELERLRDTLRLYEEALQNRADAEGREREPKEQP